MIIPHCSVQEERKKIFRWASSLCALSFSIPEGTLLEQQKHQEAKRWARPKIVQPSDLGKLFNLFVYLDFSCFKYSYHKLLEKEISSYGCIQLESWSAFWPKSLFSNITIYASIGRNCALECEVKDALEFWLVPINK